MITAIEGIFILGALGGFVGAYVSGSLGIGIVLAVLAGMALAAFYGWITVYLKQHQVVTGAAINILAAGLSSFFMRVFFGVPVAPLTVEPLKAIPLPFLSRIPLLGPILFTQNILTYCMYAIVPLSWFILYRTSIGLTIRSTGENPEAVDVAGIKVERIRFSMVVIAGAMGGVAGAFYSIGYLGMFTTNIIGGRGWIAFAICFLGNWNPLGALAGTVGIRNRGGNSHQHAILRRLDDSERALHRPSLCPHHRADHREKILQRPGQARRPVQEGELTAATRTIDTGPPAPRRAGIRSRASAGITVSSTLTRFSPWEITDRATSPTHRMTVCQNTKSLVPFAPFVVSP